VIEPVLFIPVEQLPRPPDRREDSASGRWSATAPGFDDTQLFDLFVFALAEFCEDTFPLAIGTHSVFATSSEPYIGNGSRQLGPAFAFRYHGISRLQLAGLMQRTTRSYRGLIPGEKYNGGQGGIEVPMRGSIVRQECRVLGPSQRLVKRNVRPIPADADLPDGRQRQDLPRPTPRVPPNDTLQQCDLLR
jgi:hypothetical protein